MKVKVESCTKETRLTKGGVLHTGIKANGQWYNIVGDHRGLYGKEVELEIKGQWATLIERASPSVNGNQRDKRDGGRIDWEEYVVAVREAHMIANELEPDENQMVEGHINRAQARAALVNTMMIALTDGKIGLPPLTNEPPVDDPGQIVETPF